MRRSKLITHHSFSPVPRPCVEEDSTLIIMRAVKVPLPAQMGLPRREVNNGLAALLKECASPLIDGRHFLVKPEYLKGTANCSGHGAAQLFHHCSTRHVISLQDNDFPHSARAEVSRGLF